ncbi:MAG TPA: FxSxx-COOH system tetratricopeptide repeat protein [Chthonomonadaceae bacterium]|nr:FxSxx-COOH system tetratricopeptide repeat protein [Chthonomonadaceae bacterium]
MQTQKNANRYVQLTETGVKRLHAARRRYRTTVDDVVGDMNTPSVNTVKRALRQQPVFVSTLERIWDYFQRRAAENGERLPYLAEATDYVFVDGSASASAATAPKESRLEEADKKQGWISRHVPRPNRLFTGRREALDRLRAALQAGPAALIADPQALTGLGGIGKTQTAIAYIYQYWRAYDRVFWVSAETVEMLNDGLVSLAEELELLEAAPARKSQALQKMHDWFRRESHWLLVLDNADDLDALAPYFPRHHAGHLILTTRARNTVKWAAPIALDKLAREEGALLLLRRAGILGVHQALGEAPKEVALAAGELCDALDGLPLALDQAGAYLAETGRTVRDYLAFYRECGLRLLDSVTDEEHACVTVTFTLALEQMAKRSTYGREAVAMVRLCAFLAPDAIPEAIFTAYPFGRDGSDGGPSEEPAPYDAICVAACSYSMATRNPENKTLTMHRLVQKVMRDTLSPGERQRWIGRAVEAVAAATPDFEFEDWSLCDLLLPQWRLCAGYIREENIETAGAAYLLYQAGRYLRARALHEEAEEQLLRALQIGEKVHGAGHRLVADYLDELACLCRVLDRRKDAESLHARAVEIIEKAEGPDRQGLGEKLHNMAVFYVQYEEYPQAESLFLRALAIYEQQPSPDPLLIATALTQLAGVYRVEGCYDKAEQYCRRALEIYEELLEPDHVSIATACNNLGLLYLTIGRYEEAETLYLRALRINEKARGPEHPETGSAAWGLARVRMRQGRYEEAEAHYQRAIRIYTQAFGAQHVRTSKILGDYAEFQQGLSMNRGKD